MGKPGFRGLPTERFWKKVRKGRGCWLWTGAKTAGYGSFRIAPDHHILAHRYAYELLYGPIPEGKFVLHSCDIRSCVRHLFLGTNQENMIDAAQKGRLYKSRGWCNPKLCLANIPKITRLAARGTAQTKIAKTFGVSQSQISRLLSGKTFRYRRIAKGGHGNNAVSSQV